MDKAEGGKTRKRFEPVEAPKKKQKKQDGPDAAAHAPNLVALSPAAAARPGGDAPPAAPAAVAGAVDGSEAKQEGEEEDEKTPVAEEEDKTLQGALSLALLNNPEKYMKEATGYDFRLGQKRAIRHLTHGCDVFLVMQTGGGKSITYMLPVLELEKGSLAIVVLSRAFPLLCTALAHTTPTLGSTPSRQPRNPFPYPPSASLRSTLTLWFF